MADSTMKLREAHNELAEANTERLTNVLRNSNQHSTKRLAALTRLLQTDDPVAMEAINAIIQAGDKHTNLREVAIAGVSERKRSEAIEALVIALDTGSKHIRCIAAAALGEIGNQRAVEPLIAAL